MLAYLKKSFFWFPVFLHFAAVSASIESNFFDERIYSFKKQSENASVYGFFAEQEFQKVIDLLSKGPLEGDKAHLLVLAYQAKGEHEPALKILDTLPKTPLVLCDLGVSYFSLHDFESAQKALENVSFDAQQPKLYLFAQKLLIRSDLEQGKLEEAQNKISQLRQKIRKGDENYSQILCLQGDLFLREKRYDLASICFEEALPKRNLKLAPWTGEALYQLGICRLKWAEQIAALGKEEAFDKAEKVFLELIQSQANEKSYLAYARYLLSRGKQLEDEDALIKAKKILGNENFFKSDKASSQALLMQAEAALKYEERDELYRRLTSNFDSHAPCLAESWYKKGLNDFDEALELEKKDMRIQAKAHLALAEESLEKAYRLFQQNGDEKEILALKYLAKSCEKAGAIDRAWGYLEELTSNPHMKTFRDPLEIYTYKASIAVQLPKDDKIDIACALLNEGMQKYPGSEFFKDALYQLGQLYFQKKSFLEAEKTFSKLADHFSKDPLASTALYLAAISAKEANRDEEIIKNYRRAVFENYKESSYAAECCFTFYSYQDYLQGERKALKHLQNFTVKFPHSPFTLNAFYLLGMDFKRDRKSSDGKWLSRKNLTAAIDAFHRVESLFDELSKTHALPEENLTHYVYLRYRAVLERALSNYAIAEEAKGAKRQIYLEYASEVFKSIVKDFEQSDHPLTKVIKEKELFPKLEEEASFWLAKTYWLIGEDEVGENIFNQLTQKYASAKITKGYLFSRLWYERGKRAVQNANFEFALDSFIKAEEAGRGKVLNTDETLDLLIEQSYCHQNLGELEQSMLILSQVINCDAASSLRLKAMLLRAEVYEMQGRPQLAKRQLETVVSKGGEWAKKAQEKLDRDYGFD